MIKKNKYGFISSNFYSDEMNISKKFLIENHLKLIYQKKLISDLDSKHKDWSKSIGH